MGVTQEMEGSAGQCHWTEWASNRGRGQASGRRLIANLALLPWGNLRVCCPAKAAQMLRKRFPYSRWGGGV